MKKGCDVGKRCGATCISERKACRISFSSPASNSLSTTRSLIQRVQTAIDRMAAIDRPLKTETEVVKYVGDNYEKWLTGGMEERFYGGPGQRGNPQSKFWLLGQEGFTNSSKFPRAANHDPVEIVNALRLHNKLYEIAKKEGVSANPTAGVESVMFGKPFHLDKDTVVESWAKTSGSSYYGRLGRIAKDLGYSGDLLGANASSFMMPSGQKGLSNLISLLKRNKVDTSSFANGAFKNKEAWYQASVNARLPLMLRGIKRYKPEIVYISQSTSPQEKKFSTMLLYTLSRKVGTPVYNINHNGWDYNYMVIPLPGGKKTVLINSWHPNGLRHKEKAPLKGEGAVNREIAYLTTLMNSLKNTGKPPVGEIAKRISGKTMDEVIG